MDYIDAFEQGKESIENWLKKFDNCLFATPLDEDAWNNLVKLSPKLKKAIQEGKSIYDQYSNLLFDLFLSFYKRSPHFYEDTRLSHKSGVFNRSIIEKIMNLSKYSEMRSYTRSNELNSGLATLLFHDEIKELVKKEIEEQKKLKENLDKAIKSIDKKLSKSKSGEIPKEIQKLINNFLQNADQLLDKKLSDDIKENLLAAIKKSIEEAKKVEDLEISWGFDKSDEYIKLDYEGKLKIIDKLRNSKKLQDITKVLGKMLHLLSKNQAESVETNIKCLYRIRTGREISKTVSTELLKLADIDLEPLFIADLMDGKILNYDYNKSVELMKGPIVICMDESGSMLGARETWMKSVALASLQIAKSQNRSLFAIHFACNSDYKKLHVNQFLKNELFDIEQMMDLAEFFYNGGTDFIPPLKRAMDCIDTEKDFQKADILFISDGEYGFPSKFVKDFLEWKAKRNVKTISIHIGNYGVDILKSFSDEVINIEELTEEFFVDNISNIY